MYVFFYTFCSLTVAKIQKIIEKNLTQGRDIALQSFSKRVKTPLAENVTQQFPPRCILFPPLPLFNVVWISELY